MLLSNIAPYFPYDLTIVKQNNDYNVHIESKFSWHWNYTHILLLSTLFNEPPVLLIEMCQFLESKKTFPYYRRLLMDAQDGSSFWITVVSLYFSIKFKIL